MLHYQLIEVNMLHYQLIEVNMLHYQLIEMNMLHYQLKVNMLIPSDKEVKDGENVPFVSQRPIADIPVSGMVNHN